MFTFTFTHGAVHARLSERNGARAPSISSIPPIDLGEREGGEDRNAQEKCQVQHVLGYFLTFM